MKRRKFLQLLSMLPGVLFPVRFTRSQEPRKTKIDEVDLSTGAHFVDKEHADVIIRGAFTEIPMDAIYKVPPSSEVLDMLKIAKSQGA
jgi:hypothetical protein